MLVRERLVTNTGRRCGNERILLAHGGNTIALFCSRDGTALGDCYVIKESSTGDWNVRYGQLDRHAQTALERATATDAEHAAGYT